MLLQLHPENPSKRQLKEVIECLKDGGVIIYPTDTIYSIGCDLYKSKAIERVALIKGLKVEKAEFSVIFNDISQISEYTTPLLNHHFKLLKNNLPGPFTFILNANNEVPKIFKRKKKTIGVRIPNNNIALEIVRELNNPIIATSIHDEDEILEYTTDPELIYERYKNLVDIVIDGGIGENIASTIVDCTDDLPFIIRQGIGDIDL